jgi:pyruvate kinase
LEQTLMPFPLNKTKIVCTIGPASNSPEILEQLILAGMNIARINFSHGDFAGHAKVIKNIRSASLKADRRVAIMADLPGPKIRIGEFETEPVELIAGDTFTLTAEEIVGSLNSVSVSFSRLPQVVNTGDRLFLNDGLIQLRVLKAVGNNVQCEVIIGGELRSRKGLNLPGIELGISAFTEHDKKCLKFAGKHGIDAISQSFVETGQDITAVREAASKLGYNPFIIAKVERSRALDNFDSILEAADGIMIARGDLGVEIPIEEIAVVQKRLMRRTNIVGKPVITATQMLESMTVNRRPTRAEATDVANAIIDGTDCVMLSGESAMGKYPVNAATMLAGIAAAVERQGLGHRLRETLKTHSRESTVSMTDLIALSVQNALERVTPATVIVPTRSGSIARNIARFKLPVWITAVSSQESTCRNLLFSYGVLPVYEFDHPEDWKKFAGDWLESQSVEGSLVVLTEGPSAKHPDSNNRMEIIDLDREYDEKMDDAE